MYALSTITFYFSCMFVNKSSRPPLKKKVYQVIENHTRCIFWTFHIVSGIPIIKSLGHPTSKDLIWAQIVSLGCSYLKTALIRFFYYISIFTDNSIAPSFWFVRFNLSPSIIFYHLFSPVILQWLSSVPGAVEYSFRF